MSPLKVATGTSKLWLEGAKAGSARRPFQAKSVTFIYEGFRHTVAPKEGLQCCCGTTVLRGVVSQCAVFSGVMEVLVLARLRAAAAACTLQVLHGLGPLAAKHNKELSLP